ncbi:hypothetical protein AB0D34_07590 [Streptomyces sp. NPDC048420]|uniref:hypothetical protein n=1 Tax=Streptomyces sp. NPDC048420 TaxID=3155755 RepID=UPI003444D78B
MPKRVTFTITAVLKRQDGPTVAIDDLLQALTVALEEIEVYVEDPDRDTESRFDTAPRRARLSHTGRRVLGVDHRHADGVPHAEPEHHLGVQLTPLVA